MFTGAMAGSTAGGLKISRVVIAVKGLYVSVRKLINPRYVSKVKIEGKSLEDKTISDVFAFVTLYLFSAIVVLLILSFDPVNGTTATIFSDLANHGHLISHGLMTNISAVLSCISNIGPGFEAVGPYASFAAFSPFSKLALTFTMLLGRLEILPILILFNPRTWKKS
jgi:trk system potassium uptake protein TrkH